MGSVGCAVSTSEVSLEVLEGQGWASTVFSAPQTAPHPSGPPGPFPMDEFYTPHRDFRTSSTKLFLMSVHIFLLSWL